MISIKLLCNFVEISLRHGCSPVNLLHIFRTNFTRNTSGRLQYRGPDLGQIAYVRTWLTRNHKFYKLPIFTWLFFDKYAHKLAFSGSWARETTLEIRCTCTLKQFVRQIPKTSNVTWFSFYVLCNSSYDFKSSYSF